MVLGMILLAAGLFLFTVTYYVDRTNIIVIGVIARFINGIVIYFLENNYLLGIIIICNFIFSIHTYFISD